KLFIGSTVDKSKPDSEFKGLFKNGKVYCFDPTINLFVPEPDGKWGTGNNGFVSLFIPYNVRPGRDKAWYEEQVRLNETTPWVVEANYPQTLEEALSPQSATSCFKKEVLDDLWANKIENPEMRQDCIYIIHPPRVGVSYGAMIDVGEGIGLDYSCLIIIGKSGLSSEVCAIIYTNTLGTDSFAYESDKLCKDYHSPLLVVDNIGVGRAVVDKLVDLGYDNLYKEKDKVGYPATKARKRELTSKLVEDINNKSLITRFKPQIKELMEYQWVNNYPEPTGATHGDTVTPLQLWELIKDDIGIKAEMHAYVGGRRVF
ncbi:hypothetical protein LCGC14_2634050, partial [marine sediment metagenome]